MNGDVYQAQEADNLGLIVLESFKQTGDKVNEHLQEMRQNVELDYMIPIEEIRFSNGEGKVRIQNSVRAKDIYIICDISNYSCTYTMQGYPNRKGPDEHFQDIKRTLSAIGGKARRVTVIMPLLYASRQHKRKGRESLDGAMALQELQRLGVSTVITFDAHDPTIQNAIPLVSFENIYPTYSMLKHFISNERDVSITKDDLVVISPDIGAMDRAVYYAGVLGLDVGMFYKRRDHSVVIEGKNPILEHKYIGPAVKGKSILIIDDMIASGDSVFDVATELKAQGAAKVFIAVTFAFFTAGIEKFNKFYKDRKIDRVYATNLSFLPPMVRESEWFVEVDASKFLAKIINTLNHDMSMAPLLNPAPLIQKLLRNDI